MECDAVDLGKSFAIESGDVLVVSYVVVDNSHLSAAYTGADVAHAVVVANVFVLIVGVSLAGLSGEEHDFAFGIGIGADESTAAAGGNHLIAVEREHAVAAESATHLTAIAAAEALGCVFYYGNAVAVGHIHYFIEQGRHAVEVDRHNGFWGLTGALYAVDDGFFEQFGRDVPSERFAVDEHRGGAEIFNGVAACAESETLANHLVAGSHAKRVERQMHCSSARRESHYMLVFAYKSLKVSLKAIDIRSQRHHPIVGKSLFDIFHFVAAHVSQAE